MGLIINTDGTAHQVLTGLGLEVGKVRERIEGILGRSEPWVIHPATRVKKVVEIAFEEAKRVDNSYVGTEHLLLGLLIEQEGIAAHVLEELGASTDKVRAEIERVRAGGAMERTGTDLPELGPDTTDLLRYASVLVSAEGASAVGLEHVTRALDNEAVRSLLQMAARIRQAMAARDEAIAVRDFDAAKERWEEVGRLGGEYDEAESTWRRRLG